MLDFSDILYCVKCELYKNGRCCPFFVPEFYNDYWIIGEAPGKNEILEGLPFCGPAGDVLWNVAGEFGLKRNNFFIINSVNCRPVIGNKNGKPTPGQMRACETWIEKYLKILRPKKIILLGDYAMKIIGEGKPTLNNAKVSVENVLGILDTVVVRSVHPAYAIYNKDLGKDMLKKSFETFVGYETETINKTEDNIIDLFF
ncbi:MAG: uracil-DNA glycosylase [Elusimicrobiota bacterium]